jgi:iron complex transport system ATP-binding protein
MSFRAERLGFAYGLEDATFQLPSSGLIAVVGPNGAGKSTMVSIIAGLRQPYRGSCQYSGKELRQWPRREFARRVAFLPQFLRLEFPFTAEQVVFMGRTPYAAGWFESPADHDAVERAIVTADIAAFRSRDFRTLSGGERQRVILASALAQEPETLLLDEPTTFLDLKHQLSMYRLLSGLARRGFAVVAVTHDLNLALRYADRTLVLDHGRLVADGITRDVLTPDLIGTVFGVRAHLHGGSAGNAWFEYDATECDVTECDATQHHVTGNPSSEPPRSGRI